MEFCVTRQLKIRQNTAKWDFAFETAGNNLVSFYVVETSLHASGNKICKRKIHPVTVRGVPV